VPLQKPKRKNYTVTNNYQPISLLPTLGKALELLVAERIAYLVEEYGLLPKTHFSARKQRATTHVVPLRGRVQDSRRGAERGRYH
jgi:hypothetical protein